MKKGRKNKKRWRKITATLLVFVLCIPNFISSSAILASSDLFTDDLYEFTDGSLGVDYAEPIGTEWKGDFPEFTDQIISEEVKEAESTEAIVEEVVMEEAQLQEPQVVELPGEEGRKPDKVRIIVDGANLRMQANAESEILTVLLLGTELSLIEAVLDGNETIWYKVLAENLTGYLRSDVAEAFCSEPIIEEIPPIEEEPPVIEEEEPPVEEEEPPVMEEAPPAEEEEMPPVEEEESPVMEEAPPAEEEEAPPMEEEESPVMEEEEAPPMEEEESPVMEEDEPPTEEEEAPPMEEEEPPVMEEEELPPSEEEIPQEEEASPEEIQTVTVIVEEAGLKAEANAEAEILAYLPLGTTVQLLEIILPVMTEEEKEEPVEEESTEEESADEVSVEEAPLTWYKVLYEETEGYLNSQEAIVTDTQEHPQEEEEVEETSEPAVITVYDYHSPDVNVLVTLTNPEDLPDDAELVVIPVSLTTEEKALITEEAIKEEKAVEQMKAFDIKFIKDGTEIQPGASVKVTVSLPEIEVGQEAAVFHLDANSNVENMDGMVTENGDVEFETEHFSVYVIVQQGDENVTVTIEHYDNTKEPFEKIYSNDEKVLPVGGMIRYYNKATNWNVVKVVVGEGETARTLTTEAEFEEIQVASNTKIKVYYEPIIVEETRNPVKFFDYTARADNNRSINMSLPSSGDNRLTVGANDGSNQNFERYRYNCYSVNGVNANLWINDNQVGVTDPNRMAKGLLRGIGADNLPVFNVHEPGLFVENDWIVNGTWLRRYYTDFELGFSVKGDTYTLDSVYRGENKVFPNHYQNEYGNNYGDKKGSEFWPLDGLEQPGRNFDDYNRHGGSHKHNQYFGMRYDISFKIGDYIGPLNYTFTGDDDLWVVLDNTEVVLDLGGIHSACRDSVDLWKFILTDGQTKETLTKEQKEKQHSLTILYMERGACESNCSMEFTLPSAEIIDVTSVPLANLSLKKTDETGEPLEGAEFILRGNGIERRSTSLSDGSIVFANLRAGEYQLEETAAPDGYILNPNASRWVVRVTVSGNQAIATLYEADGVTPVSLQEDGYRIINEQYANLEIEKLVVSDPDYIKGDSFVFYIYKGQGDVREPYGTVKFEVSEAADLSGLRNEAGNYVLSTLPSYQERMAAAGVSVYYKRAEETEFTTSTFLYTLTNGAYEVEEEISERYDLRTENNLLVTFNSETKTQKCSFTNEKATGSLLIEKRAISDEEYLKGKTFRFNVFCQETVDSQPTESLLGTVEYQIPENADLTGVERDAETGALILTPETEAIQVTYRIGEETSGENFLQNLPYGSYKVTEEACDGFERIDENENVVTIDQEHKLVSASFINQRLSGITINKSGSDGEILPGVVFKLEKKGDTTFAPIEGTTNENGNLTFSNLPQGEYTLTEISAPENYSILAEPILITLPFVTDAEPTGENAQYVTISSGTKFKSFHLTYDIVNNKLLVMPESGGTGGYIITILGLIFLASAVGLLLIDRRRNR